MGKIQLGIMVLLLLCGCMSAPIKSESTEASPVAAPWGYIDYCNRNPTRLECSK